MIDPIEAAATVTDPVADREFVPTVVVAVMASVPLHPFAEYVAVAMPVVVVTGDVIRARPCATQVELNVTVALWEYKVPSDCCKATVKLVLPPADSAVLATPITDGWKLAPAGLPICTVVEVVPATT